jgi:diamine N-acetyltransferase
MIRGRLITLRPACEGDRRRVYEWMAESEVTRWMMGPPLFPEAPVPTWDEFCADYVPLFLTGHGRTSEVVHPEVDGEAVGHVSYSEVDPARARPASWTSGCAPRRSAAGVTVRMRSWP